MERVLRTGSAFQHTLQIAGTIVGGRFTDIAVGLRVAFRQPVRYFVNKRVYTAVFARAGSCAHAIIVVVKVFASTAEGLGFAVRCLQACFILVAARRTLRTLQVRRVGALFADTLAFAAGARCPYTSSVILNTDALSSLLK